jgi:hypothetical protein
MSNFLVAIYGWDDNNSSTDKLKLGMINAVLIFGMAVGSLLAGLT